VLERAVRDINGSHCNNGYRQERVAPFEALTFIEDAGEMFEFWATLTGRDPCCARRGLLQRVPRDRLAQVRADLLWLQSGAGGSSGAGAG